MHTGVQVSAASAYVQTGAFDFVRTLLLCVAATAVIGWLNLRWAVTQRCSECLPGLGSVGVERPFKVSPGGSKLETACFL